VYSLHQQASAPQPQQTPQRYLDKELSARGYSVQRYTTINSGYSNMPTPLQLASYDVHLLKMIVRDKDEHALREVLSCGISPNACTKHGESLLHKVCKSGSSSLLQVFLDCGADVQVSDGAGRTLLHNACWGAKPAFKAFELVLQQDVRLIHMMDGSGTLPLANVRDEHHGAWNMFLKTILNKYWPVRNMTKCSAQGPPSLAMEKACSHPVANPDNALSLELAAMVACGRMEPDEAIRAQELVDDADEHTDETIMCTFRDVDEYYESEYDSEDDSEYDSEDDSDDESELDFDEIEELREIAKVNAESGAAL